VERTGVGIPGTVDLLADVAEEAKNPRKAVAE
jgi:hypothetical protein